MVVAVLVAQAVVTTQHLQPKPLDSPIPFDEKVNKSPWSWLLGAEQVGQAQNVNWSSLVKSPKEENKEVHLWEMSHCSV